MVQPHPKNGASTRSAGVPAAEPVRDRQRYGWRYVLRHTPDGRKEWDEVPLTLEDVCYPQVRDVIPQGSLHQTESSWLKDVIKFQLRDEPAVDVFSDCLVNWGIPGMRDVAPDVSLFDQVRDVGHDWGTFPMKEQGARILLAIEVVTPDRRENDVTRKFADYYRANVPIYVIVDRKKDDGPRNLLGYRHTPAGFAPMPLDAEGRLDLRPIVNLLLGLQDNLLVCHDAITGERLGSYGKQAEGRRMAEQARQDAERARQDAEQRAQQDREARQRAEDRLQALEEELRRLRGE